MLDKALSDNIVPRQQRVGLPLYPFYSQHVKLYLFFPLISKENRCVQRAQSGNMYLAVEFVE